MHPFGCTRSSRCASEGLSFAPALALALSFSSGSLPLRSFPFFPSKLWQVGVDSGVAARVVAGFAAICYLLVQQLVNGTRNLKPSQNPPTGHPGCPFNGCCLCYLLVGNCIACTALLLLGKRAGTAHVLVYIMCTAPKLHLLHSYVSVCGRLDVVCVCEDVEKQKVYNYN